MHLRHVLERARNHQAGVRQVEALTENSRKIQYFRHNHPVLTAWKVIGHVIEEHGLRIPKPASGCRILKIRPRKCHGAQILWPLSGCLPITIRYDWKKPMN